MSEPVTLDVYYVYGCPYVYAAAIWLRDLKALMGDDLTLNWKYFPLEQVNAGDDPDWKLWEQPLDFSSRGRMAFHGAIAARNQSEAAFEAFHYALLDAKHLDGQNLGRRQIVIDVARRAGLDVAGFERDLDDASLLANIGLDYEEGRSRHGVFGTPTLV
ncbi:MAG: DsbA family protein, partial [Thermomicrobiales bacterium]